jgi:hypothetical protein
MTMTSPSPSSHGVPLPRLSDEAAVELYLFVEHVFLLIEARYGGQIRRHFEDLSRDSLIDSDGFLNMDDPPF